MSRRPDGERLARLAEPLEPVEPPRYVNPPPAIDQPAGWYWRPAGADELTFLAADHRRAEMVLLGELNGRAHAAP